MPFPTENFSNPIVTAPNAPITGITVTFFILQICGLSSFRGQYFSIFLVLSLQSHVPGNSNINNNSLSFTF